MFQWHWREITDRWHYRPWTKDKIFGSIKIRLFTGTRTFKRLKCENIELNLTSFCGHWQATNQLNLSGFTDLPLMGYYVQRASKVAIMSTFLVIPGYLDKASFCNDDIQTSRSFSKSLKPDS